MERAEIVNKVKVLLEAFPYIQKFQSSLVLIKLGGSLMNNEENLNSVLTDIAFMHCIGMKPIIVHGGGVKINQRLEQLAIPVKKIAGLRHSDSQVIRVVDDVLHNQVNKNLVARLQKNNQRAKGLSGKEILLAKKVLVFDSTSKQHIDLGFVGEVEKVNTQKIVELVKQDIIPVITPLGQDARGDVYNINADIVAAAIAKELVVRKLVFLSDVPGLLMDENDNQSLISSLALDEVTSYIDKGVISGGMQPKVLAAVDALHSGTKKVHFIDGRVSHSLLLELFTDEGIGTQIIH